MRKGNISDRNISCSANNPNRERPTPLESDYNLVVDDIIGEAELGFLAGENGLITDFEAIRFVNPYKLDYSIAADSAAAGAGTPLPNLEGGDADNVDIGPFELTLSLALNGRGHDAQHSQMPYPSAGPEPNS